MGYDSSLNGNVSIGNDLTIVGRLNVRQYSSQNIINTTTTNYQLIVSEDLSLNGRMYVSGNVGIGRSGEPFYTLDVSSASTQPFRVGVGSTNALVVDNNGRVGIGTTNPVTALDVNGVIRSNNLPKYWNFLRLFTAGGIINTSNDAYFLIGTLGDHSAGFNGGSINIKGTIGGYSITEKSAVDITITSRGATATTIGVIGTMNGTVTLANLKSYNDFVVYYHENKYNIYYFVKRNTFIHFDFAVSGNDMNSASSILSEPTASYTTTVSGTLLSGTPSILSALQQYTIDGNVGIGITNPNTAAGLEVRKGPVYVSNSGQDTTFCINSGNGQFVTLEAFNIANTTKRNVCISPYGGNLGIGTTNPGYALDVNGSIRSKGTVGYRPTDGNSSNTMYYYWSGTQFVLNVDNVQTYGVSPNSDYRIKHNFREPQDILNRLCKIKLFDYQYKDIGILKNDGHYRLGLFAHELQEMFPDYGNLVQGEKDGLNNEGEMIIQSITGETIQYFLLKAIQEQQQMIENLQTENQDLKHQQTNISQRLTALENK